MLLTRATPERAHRSLALCGAHFQVADDGAGGLRGGARGRERGYGALESRRGRGGRGDGAVAAGGVDFGGARARGEAAFGGEGARALCRSFAAAAAEGGARGAARARLGASDESRTARARSSARRLSFFAAC
jgi:hypothetical protein